MRKLYAPVALVAAIMVIAALAACGGDDGEEAGGQTTTVAITEQQPTESTAPEQIPDDLIGTYETKLPKGAFPAGTWGMSIGPRGELFIIPPGETGFNAAPVSVSGNELVLSPEPDACSIEGRYSYELTGDSLTLTKIEDCPDREWVMSQEPWTKTG